MDERLMESGIGWLGLDTLTAATRANLLSFPASQTTTVAVKEYHYVIVIGNCYMAVLA